MKRLITFFSHKPFKKLFLLAIFILIAGLLFIVGWFYSYRYEKIISLEKTPLMKRQSIEGYTGQYHYQGHDTVRFFLRSTTPDGKGFLRRITKPYRYDTLATYSIGKISQPINNAQANKGCAWKSSLKLPINDTFKSGFYNLHLSNKKGVSNISFLVNKPKPNPEVAILVPVTTWVAYNQWGGKSLYKNGIDSSKVYEVSADRPNTALNYTGKRRLHSIPIQANIYHWFDKRFRTTILPDYSLEKLPKVLKEADIIVLAYHCEYFSKSMYDNLEQLVYRNKSSLISLGGNQIYWKVRWHDNYSRLECHKDLTCFKNSWSIGGMWRHNLRPEAGFLGVQFTPSGMGTYAPYKVLKPGHWLYKGIDTKKGDLFGRKGINQYPICGDETDKTTFFSQQNVVTLAKGLNPVEAPEKAIYQEDKGWQGKGGGEMVFKPINEQAGIVATGSIQSGSGLGRDSVFTAMIRNFTKRYTSK